MSYDTIMNLQFYIFENILNHYTAILEERKEAEKKEAKEQGYDQNQRPEDLMRQAQKNLPKMPNVSIPKIG